MKKSLIILAVIALFAAACSAEATPTQPPAAQPKDTMAPQRQTAVAAYQSGTPLPDYTPKPTKQPITGPVARVSATCTLNNKPVETRVAQGTTIILFWTWIAQTQEQVQAFIDNAVITVTFDGQPVTDPRQERIQPTDDGKFSIAWGANVGVPAPGSHAITYSVTFKTQITNGVDTFGPGGKTETLNDACTLIIE
ncbi:MAG: hypothetical protein AB1750_00500 [Chloroflexota bacterium]